MLAPYIDIYLPDFKYMDPQLALRYSHAQDYPTVALKALKEMYNQKGSALPTDDDGLAYRGIIVRHLVLPGQVENSLAVLDEIADLSPNLHVALMAQYFPPTEGLPDQLGRTLTEEEYARVTDHFYAIGLHRGWVQELSAQQSFRPDFTQQQAFEMNVGLTQSTN
jgi:putative pyruvate formate lyase activating enzyme